MVPVMGRHALLLASCLAVAATGCRMKRKLPSSAEDVLSAVVDAAKKGDAERIYALLDKKSRWSIISVRQAEREARKLVVAHYPRGRQARELRRTALAARAEDAKAYFVAWVRQRELLGALARFGEVDRRERKGDRLTLHSKGATVVLCRAGDAWRYCSLRAQLDRMKVRAARDLTTVRESAEAFEKR